MLQASAQAADFKVGRVVRQNSARPNIVRVTMLQGSPHIIHFKRILDFGEGQDQVL